MQRSRAVGRTSVGMISRTDPSDAGTAVCLLWLTLSLLSQGHGQHSRTAERAGWCWYVDLANGYFEITNPCRLFKSHRPRGFHLCPEQHWDNNVLYAPAMVIFSHLPPHVQGVS